MPSRNSRKDYVAESFYHVYNRGVAKQDIFRDDLDYRVFLSYFKTALQPEDEEVDDKVAISSALAMDRMRRLNLNGDIQLQAYCLMPNHFHLLVYQESVEAMAKLLQSTMTGYAMYFNRRYERVGPLFQGRYKASLVNTDSYALHISRYIHLNSIDLKQSYKTYPYSSYQYYTGKKKASWLHPDLVSQMFNGREEYARFVDTYVSQWKNVRSLKKELANELEM